jgi:leader peptidase (prepilin peptidase)/N-methyltransferase
MWMSLTELPTGLLWSATGLLGLLVGSFLNVVMVRLPRRMHADWRQQAADILDQTIESDAPPGLVTPRSRCPLCQHPIAWYDNIPLLSWLLLKGRCRHCGGAISVRYPLVELGTALLSVAVVVWFGASAQAAASLLLLWALIALTGIDLEHQLLPDQITLPLLWLGLLLSVFDLFVSPTESIIGAVAGYLSLWTIYHGYRLLTGKHGLGHGDFKLLAALGAWLGWMMLPLVILLASISGALIGGLWLMARGHDRLQPIPFGPFLAAAGLLCLLFGQYGLHWWLG